MKSVVLLLALILIATPALGFWSTGHMIVAQIAYNELQKLDPDYLKQIESEIEVLSKYANEKLHPFVESAVWADDNKGISWSAFNEWHFVDTPVILDQWKGETEVEPMNVTFAIKEMKKTLSNKNKPKFNSDLALSFAWRYLIHMVGDLHQPLHASTLYSDKFPQGDRGGNSFKITYSKDISNLHALWDACIDQYGSIWAPLNDNTKKAIETFALNITAAIPRSHVGDRLSKKTEAEWAEEAYYISKEFVYGSISPDTAPSQEYIDSRRHIVDEQLAVAGYRLADLMVTLRHARYSSAVEELLSSN